VIARPWTLEDTDLLEKWKTADPEGMAQTYWRPPGVDAQDWLDLFMKVRVMVEDSKGDPVAAVGLTPVFLPMVFVAPDRRNGRNVISAVRAAASAAEGKVGLIMALTRHSNAASRKLCEKVDLVPLVDRNIYLGRV
jgi:hypothetical protein